MPRKDHRKADAIEHDMELALNPGVFVPEETCFSFAVELGKVAARIEALVADDPVRAAVLLETFIAGGCCAKAEEVDDSSGGFHGFVHELCCAWIKARQAGGTGPEETVRRLLMWMDDDPHALFFEVEKDAAGAFDRAGLAELVEQVRERFDAAAKPPSSPAATFRDRPEYVIAGRPISTQYTGSTMRRWRLRRDLFWWGACRLASLRSCASGANRIERS